MSAPLPPGRTRPANPQPGNRDGADLMVERVEHWYYAERAVCGFASDIEPPCVKSPGHNGDHDGTYQPTFAERFSAWTLHRQAEGRREMARDAAEDAAAAADQPDLEAKAREALLPEVFETERSRFVPAPSAGPDTGPWRVGEHYGIHVYEGDRPVATFHRAEDADRAVLAVNRGQVPDDELVLLPPRGWLNRIDEVMRDLLDGSVGETWTPEQLAAFRTASERAGDLVRGWAVGLTTARRPS